MTDIAFFVEDPGAVAFIDGVPEALAKMGYTSRHLSIGDDILGALAVVVGTGEDRVWPSVLEVARRNNVPAIALVDSCTSVGHRKAGLDWSDYVAVPDKHTRQLYYGFDRVRACGHPRHDALYAMRDGRMPGGNRRPVVMFCTELSSSCDPALDKEGRTEHAIEAFLAAVKLLPMRPTLILRLHPKTPRGLYNAYLAEFDTISESGFTPPSILYADVVVGLTSSILDEAVVLGRSVLSLAPPSELHALAGWRRGLIAHIDTGPTRELHAIAGALRRILFERPDLAAVETAFPRGGAANVARLISDAIMGQMPTLDDGTVRLEPFAHLTDRYVQWLNDPETVKYSEQRHSAHTLESCKIYRESLKPPHKLWAIIAPPFGHVGNVSATVDKHNRVADLAILIGRRGQGIGTRAWTLALDWLLGPGGMRKVTAGTMAANEPMLALMKNSGMVEEGRQRGRFLLGGVPTDAVMATKERGECQTRG